MTLYLPWPEYLEQFQKSDKEELHFDSADKQDTTLYCTGQITEGWMRFIHLRFGFHILIEKMQNRDRLILEVPEMEWRLTWNFIISGKQIGVEFSRGTKFLIGKGKFYLSGNGLVDRYTYDLADIGPFLLVTVFVRPGALLSFVGDSSEELPKVFRHLIRPSERPCYKRSGEITPVMGVLLQQILQCPYKGLTKRVYLESKVIELLALLMEEEADIHQSKSQPILLELDYRDRIQYAQEILIKNLTSPPSLMELASLVGMCDYNLRQGFKEVFDTTVFGYLRDFRLDRAKQLLLEPWMTVSEVARTVGYESHSSFTAAFQQRFGVSPKAYRISARK